MANLIITVISIALIAVAALMGAYYGGSAFMEGQKKAQANSIIASAEQMAGAWRIYALDNSGNSYLTGDTSFTALTPKYLAQLPYFSFANLLPGYEYNFRSAKVANDSYAGIANDANIIALYGVPEKICKQINFIATGTASVTSTPWAGLTSTNAALADLKPFYCMYYGASPPNQQYAFVYKVF